MRSRLLTPLLLLVAALALPAAAGAASTQLATPGAHAHEGTPLSPKAAVREAQAVASGRGVERGFELTPLLKEVALGLPDLRGADRRRGERLLARPTDPSDPDVLEYEPPYTVREHAPHCTAHFCVHWVTSSQDRPPLTDSNGTSDGDGIPDYVETTAAVFERVYEVENVQLGWRRPKSDRRLGCPGGAPNCLNRTDVYIKQIGDEGLYGFATADGGQDGKRRHAYLVVDNDYADETFSSYSEPRQPLEVTAAHEYNHVLQFGYDISLGTWMFEATATWMEDEVFTEVNDYLQYLPAWVELTLLPLTNELGSTDEFTGKTYGNAVWNMWIAARFGANTIRQAWERSHASRPVPSFAPGAYDRALAEHRSSFYAAFTRFAAETAEWRASDSPFDEGRTFPDVARATSSRTGRALTMRVNGGSIVGDLSVTTHVLVNVARTAERKIKFVASAPRGARMAIALIGRDGGEVNGTQTVALTRMRRGGFGTVTLRNPGRFERITVALINGDARTTGRRFESDEWQYRRPSVELRGRLSSDFKAPRITSRSPSTAAPDLRPADKGSKAARRGVSRRTRIRARFSERVVNVRSGTVVLRGPRGRKVKAKVKLRRGRTLTITPRKRLRGRARYTVQLSGSIRDRGGNRLRVASRRWSFRTRR